MSLFERITGELSKGYRDAVDRPSPSSQELQTLRTRAIDTRDDTEGVRTKEQQTALDLEVSEIDSMIARADKLADQKAKGTVPT